jgi:hypothetical protein
MLTGREEEALELARNTLAEARQLGQPTLETAALYANALALSSAAPQDAITLLQESIDMARRFDIDSERLSALALLAVLEAQHGDARRSLEAIREPYLFVSQGYVFTSLLSFGVPTFDRVGRPDLIAKCVGHGRRRGVISPDFYKKLNESHVEAARVALGDTIFDELADEGANAPTADFNQMILREIDDLLADM